MKPIDIKSMLVGILLCACLFLIMGQKTYGGDVVFDTIRAKSIIIEDDESEVFIFSRGINFTQKKYLAHMGAPGIRFEGIDDGMKSILTPGGLHLTNSKDGEKMYAELSSYNGWGKLELYNSVGNIVTNLTVNKTGDGLIILNDRYGELGYGVSGKLK